MTFTKAAAAWLLFIAAFFITSCANEAQGRMEQTSIRGVWEYMEDDMLQEIKGMSFFGERHFAFVVNFQADSASAEPRILAHSGTYEMQDSIVTATILYSHNPSVVGQKIRWIHGVKNDTASYKVLSRAGEVVENGRIRRLE